MYGIQKGYLLLENLHLSLNIVIKAFWYTILDNEYNYIFKANKLRDVWGIFRAKTGIKCGY